MKNIIQKKEVKKNYSVSGFVTNGCVSIPDL